MTDRCRKKPLEGLGLCELPKGHPGPHRDGDQQWARREGATRSTPQRSGGLKRRRAFAEVPESRRGFWYGLMAAALRRQEQSEGFNGFYRCECGMPDCDAVVEGFIDALKFFVPGHVKPRAEFNHKGFRFPIPVSLGPDDPDNVVPVTSECNRREFWKRVAS